MVKRLNIAFEDSDHLLLLEKKEQIRKESKLNKLSWENFILHIAGINDKR